MNRIGKIEYLKDLGFKQDKKITQVFTKDLDTKFLSLTFPSTNEEVLEMNEFARYYCITHESMTDSVGQVFDTFEELLGYLFSNLDPFWLNLAFLEQIEYVEPYYKKCEKCRTKIHYEVINTITTSMFSVFPKEYENKLLCDSCVYDTDTLYRVD